MQSGQGFSEALVSPLSVCVCICHQFTPLIFVIFLLPLFSIVLDVGRYIIGGPTTTIDMPRYG